MTTSQLSIDWTRAVHEHENNPHSQAHLDRHRMKFTGQVAVVYSLLQKGIKLTSDVAADGWRIRHLARRIGDLAEQFGIDIDREWVNNNGAPGDVLVYFLPENRDVFIKKGWIINRPRWWRKKEKK